MRTTRLAALAGLLGLGALLTSGAAFAAPGDGDGKDGKRADAGTSFRTATGIEQGQKGTASASTGDYLYWSFPADAGRRPTVEATVKLPESASGASGAKWRIDVYDGLRRRQPCMYGMQARTATGSGPVELACTLRTVRAWSDTWADDPLPGTYYIRLTATGLRTADLGQPVTAEVEATSKDIGGSAAVDGTLGAPLVPGSQPSAGEPEDGWASGWWTDRWIWTGAGGVLAALAGVGGYTLTRGRGQVSSPSGA
ncbi:MULTISPECIES: hypothetical protein [Streptomyces]|uniref:Peptidase n=2 Tax=Streptomyces TaxID=1883 RepID=A0A0W7X0U0_9ACTN|nr:MULTISPECIES: hypothetical protein [Streptomyces]KUF16424.1 hypothetical protein AT728_11455 [Streptomyces silvensis]